MDDLNDIMAVIAEARSFMASLDNPQWSDGFPSESYIADRIDRRLMYVVRCCGEAAGVFSVTDDEPDYEKIDGKWLNDGAYLAVHTVAVGAKFRGMGVAKFIFANSFAMAEEGRKVFVFGHPEYDRLTLEKEYMRDKNKGLDIQLPKDYFPNDDSGNRPLLLWRAHANTLYTNWINYYVYQTTPYVWEDEQ